MKSYSPPNGRHVRTTPQWEYTAFTGGDGIYRRDRWMRLSACDFGCETRVQWLQHNDGRRCGRRGLWRCLWVGSPYVTFLLECNDAIILKLGNAGKARSRHEDLAGAAVSQAVRSMCTVW